MSSKWVVLSKINVVPKCIIYNAHFIELKKIQLNNATICHKSESVIDLYLLFSNNVILNCETIFSKNCLKWEKLCNMF